VLSGQCCRCDEGEPWASSRCALQPWRQRADFRLERQDQRAKRRLYGKAYDRNYYPDHCRPFVASVEVVKITYTGRVGSVGKTADNAWKLALLAGGS